MKGLIDQDKSKLCQECIETVQHLLARCKKLAGSEYVKRHDNALNVLAVQWAITNGLLPEGMMGKGKVIENNSKLYWEWEHNMRKNCMARRPDLMLQDSKKKENDHRYGMPE